MGFLYLGWAENMARNRYAIAKQEKKESECKN